MVVRAENLSGITIFNKLYRISFLFALNQANSQLTGTLTDPKTSDGILDRSSRNQQICKELQLSRNPKGQSSTHAVKQLSKLLIVPQQPSALFSKKHLNLLGLHYSVQIFWIPLSLDGNKEAVSLAHPPTLSIGWLRTAPKSIIVYYQTV